MNFDVTILGCGSALPTMGKSPSAQVVHIHNKMILLDCGEGTQVALRRNKIKFQKINQIFITHLHGDHFFGLIGFLSSLHLLGRTKSMTIYGPLGLEDIISVQFKYSKTSLNFTLNFIVLDTKKSQIIFEDNTFEVISIPLKHKVDCSGFLINEKPKSPKINKSKIEDLDLTVPEIQLLKLGKDIKRGEIEYSVDDLTHSPEKSKSYAYLTDTKKYLSVVPMIKDVDLLYHESTFLISEKDRAKATMHSTAKDAAEIAKLANVKRLLLGHFSARYNDDEAFLNEAIPVFAKTDIAEEGRTYSI